MSYIYPMKLPYGQSNFRNVATAYYYVDRTMYIEKLEQQANTYLFYLRPRKFGKSLFVSMLEYYYGLQHKGEFERIFGKYYIGQHPTPLANSYLVLVLDFSGIQTDSKENVLQAFTSRLRNAIKDFFNEFRDVFQPEDEYLLHEAHMPADVLDTCFTAVKKRLPGRKLYILIDEYDHFANELMAFRLEDFKEIVSRNGFVRKFFEVIKEESRGGLVERIFATGVSPITLDSLTSGFNIAEKITTELNFHQMMGFTEVEAKALLAEAGVKEADMPSVIADLRGWYNGYLFHPDAQERLYNPNMLIYFANAYQRHQRYPEKLLDENIASDYGKIQQLLGAAGEEMSLAMLEEVLAKAYVRANLTGMFTFEREWTSDDLTSLLFYLGVLTVRGRALGGGWAFAVPNQVIKQLYLGYFAEVLRRRSELPIAMYDAIKEAVVALSVEADVGPLLAVVERVLERMSNRDARAGFGENHLKAVFAALLTPSQVYLVRSEPEASQRYVDLLCTGLPGVRIRWNVAFELKYLKKSEAGQLAAKAEAARAQLEDYLRTEDLKHIPHLAAYAMVFVGPKAEWVERVQ